MFKMGTLLYFLNLFLICAVCMLDVPDPIEVIYVNATISQVPSM